MDGGFGIAPRRFCELIAQRQPQLEFQVVAHCAISLLHSALSESAGLLTAITSPMRLTFQRGSRKGFTYAKATFAYFSRSRILSSPARARLSSSFAPGAPLAPMWT
jgi:hypothetical protein